MLPTWSTQSGARVRFGWGVTGLEALLQDLGDGDAVVVVDVFRFSTAVDAAVSIGARVVPYRWRDASAASYADVRGAVLAGSGPASQISLDPASMLTLAPGTEVLLPSRNGSHCSAIAVEAGTTVVAGCLRNASAVAGWLDANAGDVAVIACGERWPDGGLRPAVEDYVGAAAVVAHLSGSRSAEAEAAEATWRAVAADVPRLLGDATSARELAERGRGGEIPYVIDVDASDAVPVLTDGAYRNAAGEDGE